MSHPLSDTEAMSLAFAQAKQAKKLGDHPFGAVVVHNGVAVGIGKCENSTTGDVTDHAEMIALRQACRTLQTNTLRQCEIFSTNEPCPMCSAAIFQAKIPRVVYGVARDEVGHFLRPRKIRCAQLAKDSGYPISISSGLLKEQILSLFTDAKRK